MREKNAWHNVYHYDYIHYWIYSQRPLEQCFLSFYVPVNHLRTLSKSPCRVQREDEKVLKVE